MQQFTIRRNARQKWSRDFSKIQEKKKRTVIKDGGDGACFPGETS